MCGRNSCNFPYNIVLGAIADVGDNHFGYVGFRDTNGTLQNNGAMDVVVEDWNQQKLAIVAGNNQTSLTDDMIPTDTSIPPANNAITFSLITTSDIKEEK
jgi:hypothetical protein